MYEIGSRISSHVLSRGSEGFGALYLDSSRARCSDTRSASWAACSNRDCLLVRGVLGFTVDSVSVISAVVSLPLAFRRDLGVLGSLRVLVDSGLGVLDSTASASFCDLVIRRRGLSSRRMVSTIEGLSFSLWVRVDVGLSEDFNV